MGAAAGVTRSGRAITCAVFLLTAATRVQAVEIHVPGDQPTIQAGIDAAVNTDVVIVAPGTYNEVFDFSGKAITVRSTDPLDPDVVAATVVDGTGLQNSVVKCVNDEGPETVLAGLTITGGTGSLQKSGVYLGGGMYNGGGSPTVTHCTFFENGDVSNRTRGGGMYNGGGSPTVSNCTFSENLALSDIFAPDPLDGGGGIYNVYAPPGSNGLTVTNCTFRTNAGHHGGGMFNFSLPIFPGVEATVTNCTFNTNIGGRRGGGMYNLFASPTVTNCTFTGNIGESGGGGMYNTSSPFGDATVTNCLFSGNSSYDTGAGMVNEGTSPAVTNCTFTGNTPLFAEEAGTMHNMDGPGPNPGDTVPSNPTVTNCIIWGNGTAAISNVGSSSATVNFSNVQGGYDGPGNGNIDADPRFADADGLDEVPDGPFGSEDDDLSLFITSPCIDAGDNGAVPAGVTTDLAENPRIAGGTVDMGAYEFQPTQTGGAGPRLWTNAAGGSFNQDTNWLPDAPGPGDAAVFDLEMPPYTVTFSTDATSDRAVVLDGQVTFDLGGQAYTLGGTAEGGLIGPYSGTDARLIISNGTLAGDTVRVSGNGTLEVQSTGLVDVAVALRVDDGIVGGGGTVIGLLDNGGTVRPGAPDIIGDYARLTVQGDYTQPGVLNVEIRGDVPADDHDQLMVTGAATLGGSLVVDILEGYVPVPGRDSFQVVTAGAVNGQFELLLASGLPPGQYMTIEHDAEGPTEGVSVVPVSVEGDIDFDDPAMAGGVEVSAAAVMANLDGDAFPDLAVAVPSLGGVVVLRNNDGDGTFIQLAVVPTGADPIDLVAVPLDDNASIDLAVVNSGDATVTILANDGNGSFSPLGAPIAVSGIPVAIDAATLDAGDSVDFALAVQVDVSGEQDCSEPPCPATVVCYTNNGSGSFSLGQTVELVDLEDNPIGNPTDIAAADFSGNGETDLLVTLPAGDTVQFLPNSAGDFSLGQAVEVAEATTVQTAPIDDNKDPGAIVGQGNGETSFLPNTGVLSLGPSTDVFDPPISVPVGGAVTSLGVLDIDDDGDEDLAAVVGSVIRVIRNDTQGDLIILTVAEDLPGEDGVLLVTGDLDADGLEDLVTLNGSPVPPADSGEQGREEQQISSILNASGSACAGNTDGSDSVDSRDLMNVVMQWGCTTPPGPCPADVNDDGTVNVQDLLQVILNWGPCAPGR